MPTIEVDSCEIQVSPSTGAPLHAPAILRALVDALRDALEATPGATLTDCRVAVGTLRKAVRRAGKARREPDVPRVQQGAF
jgi:hypothetical protein